MRWSIVRLIWMRELRDQLRDRRTVFMIAVLPILLYPAAGFGLTALTRLFLGQHNVVGVYGGRYLPAPSPRASALSPVPAAALVARASAGPGGPLGGLSLYHGLLADPWQDYPPLLVGPGDEPRVPFLYFEYPQEAESLRCRSLEMKPGGAADPPGSPRELLDRVDHQPLDNRQVDLLLVIAPDFLDRLEQGDHPALAVLGRESDDRSRLAKVRLAGVLGRWKKRLKDVRLLRHGLPADFDEPFEIFDPEKDKPSVRRAAEDLFDLLVRVFPFVLVLWSLAGALYPAVDLCAGEKERGTMETLLISPAGREEIVWGKFLTIWVFSAGTALLNLLSMGFTTWLVSSAIPGGGLRPAALGWGVLLLLPLSAFFSAVSLAVGAYARSSKEGQYYLMPLFLLTMPLIFLTLVPGVELNAFYCMVPVTGVALLLQKLTAASTPEWQYGLYFGPVLAPMVVFSWLALRWAIEQFQREEVLFREAERLDLGLWLRGLFRNKEALPTAGEALFCFGLILGLRWFSFNVGQHLSVLARTGISHLAFVATPPLFMALLLTTRPWRGLGLRLPPWWAWPVAVFLAVLVLPPLTELTLLILERFPTLKRLLEEYNSLTGELRSLARGDHSPAEVGQYFLALAVLPALAEELAFRGFILNGLARRFRPATAVLLSSFLFALYQMSVFQLLPYFVFGVVLGVLTLRTGSVLPAMAFHLVYNSLFLGLVILQPRFPGLDGLPRFLVSGGCFLLALALLTALTLRGRRNPLADPPPAPKVP